VPRFGVDFDGSNLPAEAGVVERAVSFTKGCYIGQEPIVRLAHRGHANRELRRLRLDEPVELPATLLDGEREVGRVTSTASLPEGGAAALGYVRRAVEDGAPLVALGARGERVVARDAGRVAAGRP
jgi:folate-binding protein YgfZ